MPAPLADVLELGRHVQDLAELLVGALLLDRTAETERVIDRAYTLEQMFEDQPIDVVIVTLALLLVAALEQLPVLLGAAPASGPH